jgi:hypothetical protein
MSLPRGTIQLVSGMMSWNSGLVMKDMNLAASGLWGGRG